MITFASIIKSLAVSTLNNNYVSENGVIGSEHYINLVQVLNDSLTELYTEFKLKERFLKVHQRTGIETYYLREDFMIPESFISDYKYIEEDLSDPFTGDIIKIFDAADSEGEPIPIDDTQYKDTGIFIKESDVIHMVPTTPPKIITLFYQANHPKIEIEDLETFNPTKYYIEIPEYLVKVLTPLVASKFYTDNNVATYYLNVYSMAIDKLKSSAVVPSTYYEGHQFTDRGWV